MKNGKVNIAFIVNYFVHGGVEKYVLTLVNKLDRKRFNPNLYIVYLSSEDFLRKLKRDVKVQHFERKSSHDINFYKQLIRRIKKDQIDLIHINNWPTFLEGILAKLSKPSLSLVYVQHGLEYDNSSKSYSVKLLIRRLFQTIFMKFCNHVISVSYAGKQYLEKNYWAKNIKVLYNGVDTRKFGKSTAWNKESFGHNDSFIICTIGRIVPVKNFLCLFKAIKIIRQKIPEIKLYHIGGNPARGKSIDDELWSFVKENKLEKTIEFLGERNDVNLILKTCDVFALTSFSEAISLSLLEAQACGLPAVVTNVGGNPEIIKHEINGILVPSNDEKAVGEGIWKLYRDSKLRMQMAINAKKIVREKFDEDEMVKNYEKIYLSNNV